MQSSYFCKIFVKLQNFIFAADSPFKDRRVYAMQGPTLYIATCM